MLVLPDVNVLVALAWPVHVHHDLAHRWFEQHSSVRWATSPLTQSGFVRVSSNRHIIASATTPREAIRALELMIAHPRHQFLADDISIADRRWVAVERLTGYRQVTDAHALGLALRHGARLLTLDRNISALVPVGFDRQNVVEVISERADT